MAVSEFLEDLVSHLPALHLGFGSENCETFTKNIGWGRDLLLYEPETECIPWYFDHYL